MTLPLFEINKVPFEALKITSDITTSYKLNVYVIITLTIPLDRSLEKKGSRS